MRRWHLVLAAAAVASSTVVPVDVVAVADVVHAAPVAPISDDPPTDAPPGTAVDPALVAVVDAVLEGTERGEPAPRVSVEVLTDDTRSVAATVHRLGGQVTGEVPDEVLLASLPAARLDALADAGVAEVVRLPQRVNRLDPVPEVHGYGGLVGQQVDIMNATAWHEVGRYGLGARVGIIDFFDLSAWNVNEHDVVPSLTNGRMFCLDNSGIAPSLCHLDGAINSAQGDVHGVAVAEIVKDVAPGAELYIATVGTSTDMYAAIDWFAASGVQIITRSLGTPYDGPGDGTGPMAAVVEHAASKGIVWFNSAGNDADRGYLRTTVPVGPSAPDRLVDFDPGPSVSNYLRVDGDPNFYGCVVLDGVRWSTDWYLPVAQRTDYSLEVYEVINDELVRLNTPFLPDQNQRAGAPPLEAANGFWCPSEANATNVTYLAIRRHASTGVGAVPDVIEVATAFGTLERSTKAGSAAKPVVDSANPSLVAVGAVHPSPGNVIAVYSSQGPTNDGRTKPDMSATSCVQSTIYTPQYGCFAGTSAASPAAAGMAALLLGGGFATPGPALAALTKHLVADLGPAGPDNEFGTGLTLLPDPPSAVPGDTTTYQPRAVPLRLLDTRATSAARPFSLLDLTVDTGGLVPPGASAVVVTITSVAPAASGFVQALPTMRSTVGGSASLNVAGGVNRSNMAIVPIGEDGSLTFYRQAGGHLVVDLLGSFVPVAGPVAAGRLVPVAPVRVLDTRPDQPGPVPTGWTAHRPAAGEIVRVEVPGSVGLPVGEIAALVVNVTATDAQGPGWLLAHPTGGAVTTTTLVYRPGTSVASHAIVPLGADGTISIATHASTHVVVDLEGYITNESAPAGDSGLFVPLAPARAYDSREVPSGVHLAGSTRGVQLTGLLVPAIRAGALAASINLSSTLAAGQGFVTLHAGGSQRPNASNLNFGAVASVANAGIVGISPAGQLDVFVHTTTHVIIDVNGYFTGPS